MTPDREAGILQDIETAESEAWLSGLVSGLRVQGELRGTIPGAIVRRCKDQGWTLSEPFPELQQTKRKAA